MARKQREESKLCGKRSFQDVYIDSNTSSSNNNFPQKGSKSHQLLLSSRIGLENAKFFDFRNLNNNNNNNKDRTIATDSASSSLASWNFASMATFTNNSPTADSSFRRGGGDCFDKSCSDIYYHSKSLKTPDRFLYRICPNSSSFNNFLDSSSFTLPNYRRVVFPSPFGFLGSGDDERMKNSSSTLTKFRASPTEQEQEDESNNIERKEVPFIDFLGVGAVSSS